MEQVIPDAGVPAEAEGPTPMRRHLPLGRVRRAVREIGLALITLGVIVLLFVGYQLVGTNFTEEHNQSRLAKQFQDQVAQVAQHPITPATTPSTEPAPSTAPAPSTEPAPPPGGAIDHLVIPKIGVDKFVVEGTNEDDLRKGPGHYTGTAYPGQSGNAAIAGHRTTYGAPFFRLNELSTGDTITITDLADRTWVYKVSSPPEVVSPNNVSVLDPTPYAQLTLTTCNPRFSATSRLVVVARLVGPSMVPPPQKVFPPTPSHRTPSVAPVLAGADNLGQGDSGAWGPAIGYGALVLALWVAVRIWINRTRKWHRLAAYVVGIGICLVPLWFCFENAVLLLPQSI